MILQIFSAYAFDRLPPKIVKSWLKTNTSRPSIVPWPVTTPSVNGRSCSMPKSVQRCVTKVSNSSKLPSSRSRSRRSRAVYWP